MGKVASRIVGAAWQLLSSVVTAAVLKAMNGNGPRHAPDWELQQRLKEQKERLRKERQRQDEEANSQRKEREALRKQAEECERESKRLEEEKAHVAEARERNKKKAEEQYELIQKEWPRPDWLPKGGVHIAICGRTGVGKSTLVNTFRGKLPKDPDASAVGTVETTKAPTPFPVTQGPLTGVTLWDLPGACTQQFPAADYIKKMGLRYFTGLFIITAKRMEEMDVELLQEARVWEIPSYLIRSQADTEIENNHDDYGTPPDETLAKMRSDLLKQIPTSSNEKGSKDIEERIFILSGKLRQCATFPDFKRLVNKVTQDIVSAWGIGPESRKAWGYEMLSKM